MMSQTHIGYTGWQQPEKNVEPETKTVGAPAKSTPDATARSAQTEGGEGAGGDGTKRGETERNKPDAAHPDASRGAATTANAPRTDALPFVESDGVVAIEAAHYVRAVAANGVNWRTIPNLGRTLSGVKALPDTAPSHDPGGDGARLEYPIRLSAAGEVDVRVVLSPTLDFLHRGGLRFAVSIGDETPQVVTMKLDPTPGSADFATWEHAVSDNAYVAISHHHGAAGAQTLKLWRVDPAVVFQRVEVWRGAQRASYLGPPESLRQ
jgi:hypothetical protein